MSIANLDEQLEVIRGTKILESLFKVAFSRGLREWTSSQWMLLDRTADKMKWSAIHLLFIEWKTIEIVMEFVDR